MFIVSYLAVIRKRCLCAVKACWQEGGVAKKRVWAVGAHGSRGVASGRNHDIVTVCHSWLLGAEIAA